MSVGETHIQKTRIFQITAIAAVARVIFKYRFTPKLLKIVPFSVIKVRFGRELKIL